MSSAGHGAEAFDVSPPEYCSYFGSGCPVCLFCFSWNGNDCSVSLSDRSRKLSKFYLLGQYHDLEETLCLPLFRESTFKLMTFGWYWD